MRYVIKLGGAGLENPTLFEGCMRAIVDLARDGNQVAVVHGGGVQLTRTLKALGKQSQFIDGLRVTDAETRDVALMVFAGRVNKSLVAALGALGQPAVGLSGGDGLLFRARKKRSAPDLGFVGEIASADPRWLEAVWQLNGVPVHGARFRRRILQHQCRRNGFGLRRCVPRRCTCFSYRRSRRQGCERRCAAMALH